MLIVPVSDGLKIRATESAIDVFDIVAIPSSIVEPRLSLVDMLVVVVVVMDVARLALTLLDVLGRFGATRVESTVLWLSAV